ncbi:MAG TPA: aspartate aminotransferase family protein [Acidimicrobiia bacterium]
MGFQGPKTAEWYQRARQSLVGGVSSGFRYWGDDDTLVIDRGEGAYVFDMDGRRYVDYQLGFGPVILGHGYPDVVAAVAEAAAEGTTFAMTQRREVEAAEKVKQAVSWVELLRFTNTGTEATMHAIRLARGATGRDTILKFEGQYHGVHDYLMFSTPGAPPDRLGPRDSPTPLPSSKGIPQAIRDLIRTLPFNDLDLVDKLFGDSGSEIAGIIVEPMLGNAYGIMPETGFLEGLRRICDEHGALLIFDEVKTGFRISLGGAQEYFGVTPDLATFAKSMGNGFPVAAVAGRGAAIRGWSEGVQQAGTYSANGVAAAAVSATIEVLQAGALARAVRAGEELMRGIREIIFRRGLPAHVVGHPTMFGIYLGQDPPHDFRDKAHHDEALYDKIMAALIPRGVLPCPDALEPWFVSAAHGDSEVAATLTAFDDSLADVLG